MPIYRVDDGKIVPVERTTFAGRGLRERSDLQTLLKSHIDVISPDTLVVAEEFGDWEDSRRRIDLLGLDRNANPVVIELKRTEDGGHMDLQAIRYAAMISTLTFDELVDIYETYLRQIGTGENARESLLEFLDWPDPDDQAFGEDVRIILASAGFSKELTTSVMWLNEHGLDIRCVRMQPYESDGQLLLDVQTIVPIPEAADYQIRIREKKRRERAARQVTRDRSRFDVSIGGEVHRRQTMRGMMHLMIAGALSNGGDPQRVIEALPHRRKLEVFEGELDREQVIERIMEDDTGGVMPRWKRFFCDDDGLVHVGGNTYVVSNQWGTDTLDTADSLARAFPDLDIAYAQSTAERTPEFEDE